MNLRHAAALVFAGFVACAASSCTAVEHTGTADAAAQLRRECDAGQQSACIDYQAVVSRCESAHGLIPILECRGVAP